MTGRCRRCQRPVLAVRSAATGWPLLLDPDTIPVVYPTDPDKRPYSARAGYRVASDDTAVVACAPGPLGWAGAGEAHDVHACRTSEAASADAFHLPPSTTAPADLL